MSQEYRHVSDVGRRCQDGCLLSVLSKFAGPGSGSDLTSYAFKLPCRVSVVYENSNLVIVCVEMGCLWEIHIMVETCDKHALQGKFADPGSGMSLSLYAFRTHCCVCVV